jgi:serine protease AprX
VQREAAALSALDAMDDAMFEACVPLLLRYTSISVEYADDLSTLRQSVVTAIKTKQIIGPHYKMVDGTSFAAPIVTSIVAQMLALNPALTPAEVKDLLMSTAKPLADQPLHRQGSGMVMQPQVIATIRQRIAEAAITV